MKERLSYVAWWVGLVVFLLASVGCSVNGTFVSAVDGAWQQIGPEYVQYLQDDATLSDDTKAIRTRTAQFLTELIEEAKQ